jgi:DsbC/DsbD-like thiol-disulfide interchange protein
VAYPAVFVLDEAGRVVHKRIQENYRAREGALKLLAESLGIGPAIQSEIRSASVPRIRVRVVSDVDAYVRWQKARLRLELDVDPGWHVYGLPIPEGYTPLQVEVEPMPGLEVGDPEYPPADPFRVEGLNEEFAVHQGQVKIPIPFAVNVPAGTGAITLKIRIGYQLCSREECLPPASLTIEVPLKEALAV